MEFFFFTDVYADRHLIDYYIVSFKLINQNVVSTKEWEGRKYITEIKDWQSFRENVYDIVLYEFGDEVERFTDIETALRTAYKMAYTEASRKLPKNILPSVGIGTPPLDVIRMVFPVSFEFEPFPKDIDVFLDRIVREMEEEITRSEFNDDDEIPF
ncbi:MAG: hypothetical protein ABWK04_01490 [Hydrogenobacter sp.]|uniref:hypothetical protein n=1 Tax=Hydrogenobacter thermophilus TaxID=940 RepID=UPI0030F937B5